jgi:hypothetical protein
MVMKRSILLILIIFCCCNFSNAQLKFLIEDFEGFADGQVNFKKEGIFYFGSARTVITRLYTTGSGYSGKRAIKVNWTGKERFGGWGIGISRHIILNPEEDFLNFYIYSPTSNKRSDNIKITLEEDDNNNNAFENNHDDKWTCHFKVDPAEEWQLISIPLKDFKDSNTGGDGVFNVGYHEGKLHTIIFSFSDTTAIKSTQQWYFDFIGFSKGKLETGATLFDPKPASTDDKCLLGAWSEEGNDGRFNKIPEKVEQLLGQTKKLGVVHFFQPFSTGGGSASIHYPSSELINKLIEQGYLPMVTMENHYLRVGEDYPQPNLYSIIEGHYDFFFNEWADRMKEVNGILLLRILHEFNGDWYSWCIANNDKNQEIYRKAFQHIVNIFRTKGIQHVKFVWCPNSMSIPQESWNYIMDAYPGDDYVDMVALDVYNGAGEKGVPIWRSFRKEAIENYYLLTEQLPYKPLLICEVASRERFPKETGSLQSKGEWIEQMAEAITTDLSKIRLLTWFNEYDTFKINSSEKSKAAFQTYIWKNDFFPNGFKETLLIWPVNNK